MYSSSTKTELTFAGWVTSALVVSPEGKPLICSNPGLLQAIHSGTINGIGRVMGGFESRVYRIALKTPKGNQDFVIKYSFPVYSDEHFHHTSGIIAMRIMQRAKKENPLPFVTYVEPLFATHNMTVAPFIFDGVSTHDVYDVIEFARSDVLFRVCNDHRINQDNQKLLQEIMKFQQTEGKKRNFYIFFRTVLIEANKILKKWVAEKIKTDPELRQFEYKKGETGLFQSVVSVSQLYTAFELFIHGEAVQLVRAELLKAIALVELGGGYVPIEE